MHLFVVLSLWLLAFTETCANSRNDSLTMFMRKALLSSTNNTKSTKLTSNMALLHCNVYCNGASKEQIVNRKCWTVTPTCKPCRCDDRCHEYGDCCPDKEGQIYNIHETKYECVGSKENDYNINGFFMITSCPDGFAIDVSESSSDIIGPVTSYITNITYINKDIALCNNVTDFKSWKKEKKCWNSLDSEHMSRSCVVNIFPTFGMSVRSCSPVFSTINYIDTCNITRLLKSPMVEVDAEFKCKEWPLHPVAAGDYIFKNIYCYLCNGLQPSSNGCSQIPGTFSTSMDILVDLNRRPVCGSHQWFDKLKNVCRHLYCRTGYKLKGNKCLLNDVKLTEVEFSFNRNFLPLNLKQQHPTSWKEIESMVIKNIPSIMAQINVFDFLFAINFMANIDSYIGSYTVPSFGIYIEFRTNRSCCRGDYEEMILDTLSANWTLKGNNATFEYDTNKDELTNLLITKSQVYQVISPSSVAKRIETYSSLSETLGKADLYVSVPISEPDCAFIYLSITDFNWNVNSSIALQYADIIVPSENIIRINEEKVAVCKRTLEELYSNYHLPMKTKDIVSLFFSILSLVCLALTFITYCTFPSLLTLPTKNTMCLVVSLFIAQLLIQFGDFAKQNHVACKTIGVLIHFFWLCVIFWMNVCSYHMFHVFVIDAAKPVTLQRQRKRLLRYLLYATGTPAIIVLATITANLGVSSGNQIGYGDGPCYLSTALLTGLSFVLPLGIVLIMNVIFFGMSVWTMAKISKMSETLGKERNNVHIYIKLSSLTGVFWIFSILAEFLNLDVFIFISIILNASQGVFIFISYMANRRILRMWTSKFGIPSPKETTKGSVSTRL